MDKKQITENWIKHKVKQMADKVLYSSICSCNPANGGSGICGCIMANQMVDPDHYGKTTWGTAIKPFTEWLTPTTKPDVGETQLEEFNEYLHMLADMKTVDLKRKQKLLIDYLKNM